MYLFLLSLFFIAVIIYGLASLKFKVQSSEFRVHISWMCRLNELVEDGQPDASLISWPDVHVICYVGRYRMRLRIFGLAAGTARPQAIFSILTRTLWASVSPGSIYSIVIKLPDYVSIINIV